MYAHFKQFLQVLEVYGSGYLDDIDAKLYKKREKFSHRVDAQSALTDIVKIYSIVLHQMRAENLNLSQMRYSKIGSNVMREQLTSMFLF